MVLLVSQSVFAQAPTISGGNAYTAMLCQNGDVYTWGDNEVGQLGRQTMRDFTSIPGKVDYFSNNGITVTAISTGFNHMLALDSEGKVYAWGTGGEGQLGNGIVSLGLYSCAVGIRGGYCVPIPEPVLAGETQINAPTDTLTGIKAISAGANASYAITSENKLLAWGDNSWNSLGTDGVGWLMSGDLNPTGIGVTEESSLPVYVINANTGTALEDVIAVSAGDYFAYALVDDDGDGDPETGRVYAWGRAFILSNPVISADGYSGESSMARLVIDENGDPITGVNIISAGHANGYFVKKNTGEVYSVGADELGQRGLGFKFSKPDYAGKVVAGELEDMLQSKYLTNVVSISVGQTVAVAVVNVDGVRFSVTWGGNHIYDLNGSLYSDIGTLSQPDFYGDYSTASPGLVKFRNGDTLKYVTSVSSSDGNVYAIQDAPGGETKLWCWGSNHVGQVGLGNATDDEDYTEYYGEPQKAPLEFCSIAIPCPTALIRNEKVNSCPRFTTGIETVELYSEQYSNQYNYQWTKNGEVISTAPQLLTDSVGTYILNVSLADESLRPEGCPVVADTVTVQAYQPNFTVATETIETDPAEIEISGTDGDVFDIYASAESSEPLDRDTITDGSLNFTVNPDSLQTVTTDLSGTLYPEDEIYKRMYIGDKSEYPVQLLPDPGLSVYAVGTSEFTRTYQLIQVATSEAMFKSIDLSIKDFNLFVDSFSIQVIICGTTTNSNGLSIVDRLDTLYTSADYTVTSVGNITVPVDILLAGNESDPKSYWVGFNVIGSYAYPNAYPSTFEADSDPIVDSNNSGVIFAGCSYANGISTESSTYLRGEDMEFCGYNLQFTTYSDYPCDLTPVDIKVERTASAAATPKYNYGPADTACVKEARRTKPVRFDVENNGLLNHNIYYFKGYINVDSLKNSDMSGAYAEYLGITHIDSLPVLVIPYDSLGRFTLVVTDAVFPEDTSVWTSKKLFYRKYAKTEVLVDPASGDFWEGNSDSVQIELNGTAPFTLAYQYGGDDFVLETEDTLVSFPLGSELGGYEFKLLSMTDKNCEAFVVQDYKVESSTGADSVYRDTIKRNYTVLEVPLSDITFNVVDELSTPVSATVALAGFADSVCDQNGSVIYTDVAAGEYAYTVSAQGFETIEGVVVLTDRDTVLAIELLPMKYSASIRVSDGTSAVENATVTVDGNSYKTDVNGEATITGIASGTYAVVVSIDGYVDYPFDLEISGSEQTMRCQRLYWNLLRQKYTFLVPTQHADNMISMATY